MNRVVITGLGVVAPNGTGIDAFLAAIKAGKSGIRFIPALRELNFGCQIGGIPDTSCSLYNETIEKYGLSASSGIIRLAIIAALEAWVNSGLKIPAHNSDDVDYDTGCIIGSGIGSADIFSEKIIPLTQQGKIKNLRSTIIEHSMLSGASANLCGILALGNIVSFNSSACSTGTEAIILGYERIRNGQARRILAGGSDAFSPFGWSGFDAMHVLTRKHNHEPERGSRPMSASASGFVPGAGAGVLLLEELNSALQRKAPVFAEIAGGYINSGGQRKGGTMTAPNPAGVVRCIEQTLKIAEIEPAQIDFISGHLSSTMADVIEIANWSEALQRKGKSFPYINSLKSMIGHCIGATGAIETIAAIIQMKNNFIHPSLNCEDLHPAIVKIIDESKIPHQIIEKQNINYIAKASFGFGDVNSCLILKKEDGM